MLTKTCIKNSYPLTRPIIVATHRIDHQLTIKIQMKFTSTKANYRTAGSEVRIFHSRHTNRLNRVYFSVAALV